jgi:hypothetical protein
MVHTLGSVDERDIIPAPLGKAVMGQMSVFMNMVKMVDSIITVLLPLI